MINRGRNWGVGVIAVTRRIQRLSKDYFDLCQHAFFFRCGLKSRGYIEDMVGKDAIQLIINLPLYHFLYYSVEEETYEVGVIELHKASGPKLKKVETGISKKPA